MKKSVLMLAVPLLACSAFSITSATAQVTAQKAGRFDNCTAYNYYFPHGVGRLHAHDHTKSGKDPVTNFLRSTAKYNTAIRHNSDLDRDNDGVACAKH